MTDAVIIGAGPAGLSCAIELQRVGLSAIVLDKGSVVDYLRRFPVNLVWFSTPELLEIGGVPFVISTVRPTREDVVRYYQRVCTHFGLDLRLHDAVVAVRKDGEIFRASTANGKTHDARTVVVATGYFDHPNRLGVPGEDLPHVHHYYDEPFRYFGARVVVVGGRNSAVEAALELFRNGVQVTLIHRGPALSQGVKYWILPDIENRIKAGQITALFDATVTEFRRDRAVVRTPAGGQEVPMEFSFVLTGFRPDAALLRTFGIQLDPETLAPRSDPVTHETTVPGLFVAGSVVAGRNTNKIFVENGRLHGLAIARSVLGIVASHR
jgi:thioredoxin reductase (NADPH)